MIILPIHGFWYVFVVACCCVADTAAGYDQYSVPDFQHPLASTDIVTSPVVLIPGFAASVLEVQYDYTSKNLVHRQGLGVPNQVMINGNVSGVPWLSTCCLPYEIVGGINS